MTQTDAHFGDPCVRCGTPHDEVAVGPCPGDPRDAEIARLRSELAELRLRCGIEPMAIEGDVFHVLDKTRVMLRAEQQSHRQTGEALARMRAENEALRKVVPLDAIEAASAAPPR